ncbi:MAG: SMP-30/gluconolactonase/LRE family protein [Chitinophagaceae bacterium]
MIATLGVIHGMGQQIGSFERLHPDMAKIVSPNAKIEIIAEGLDWSEGPLWIEDKKMLLFSDIPPNVIYKWTPQKGKEIYLKPSGYTGSTPRVGEPGSNGLILNRKGQLVLCQHGDRRMALMDAPIGDPKPKFITLADNYQGKKFDSPNDAVYNAKGDLYFTDPPYGLEKNVNDPAKEAPYQGVYKLAADGKISLLTDTISRPNGIAFMPGEKTILIANSDGKKPYWYAYDLDENGLFINGRIFYARESGGGDGLKVDKKGNIFATGPGGVWILNKTGTVLGKINIKSQTSNCALADDDKTLYVTADMYVLKITLRK